MVAAIGATVPAANYLTTRRENRRKASGVGVIVSTPSETLWDAAFRLITAQAGQIDDQAGEITALKARVAALERRPHD